jgi:hypothetical protein
MMKKGDVFITCDCGGGTVVSDYAYEARLPRGNANWGIVPFRW